MAVEYVDGLNYAKLAEKLREELESRLWKGMKLSSYTIKSISSGTTNDIIGAHQFESGEPKSYLVGKGGYIRVLNHISEQVTDINTLGFTGDARKIDIAEDNSKALITGFGDTLIKLIPSTGAMSNIPTGTTGVDFWGVCFYDLDHAIAVGSNGTILDVDVAAGSATRIPSGTTVFLRGVAVDRARNKALIVGYGGTILKLDLATKSVSRVTSPTSADLFDVVFDWIYSKAIIVGDKVQLKYNPVDDSVKVLASPPGSLYWIADFASSNMFTIFGGAGGYLAMFDSVTEWNWGLGIEEYTGTLDGVVDNIHNIWIVVGDGGLIRKIEPVELVVQADIKDKFPVGPLYADVTSAGVTIYSVPSGYVFRLTDLIFGGDGTNTCRLTIQDGTSPVFQVLTVPAASTVAIHFKTPPMFTKSIYAKTNAYDAFTHIIGYLEKL